MSPRPRLSPYYDPEWVARAIASGQHRNIIGGLWDEMGALQRDFLLARGLQPCHRLLDIGCGSLRLATKLLPLLEPGKYWGTDLHPALIEAGYQQEVVPAGLAARLPRSQLVVDSDFSFPGLPREFDYAIAQSVFTHLPLEYLRRCLERLADHLTSPCRFYFTIFQPASGQSARDPSPQKDGVVSYPDRDPYHHRPEDVLEAAQGLPWRVAVLGDWHHPRGQKMIEAVLQPGATK